MSERPRVLVVDDNFANRQLVEELLADEGYVVQQATDGSEALELIQRVPPDVVLLDIMMPGLSGFEVCQRIREMPSGGLIPVIMVTSLWDTDSKVTAARLGADDFISKPIDRVEMLTRIRSLMRIKRLTDALDGAENTILALARALEARDRYTQGHSERVALLGGRLAVAVGLGDAEQRVIRKAGQLHDIGKIGVCDGTLQSTAPLTVKQWEEIRQHPVLGVEICQPLRSVKNQLPAIRHHHERWDGAGYPDRLSGGQIPLGARIIAVCDAWDAMTSDRVYRPAIEPGHALQRLREGQGSQWDPEVVALFVERWQEITAPDLTSQDGGAASAP